ncbi:MAG: hypothetical protein ABIG11_00695 [bacterium]
MNTEAEDKNCGLESEDPGQKFIRRILSVSAAVSALLFSGLMIYFLHFACLLNVNYFDSYECLNNAKSLAGDGDAYSARCPPLATLIYAP